MRPHYNFKTGKSFRKPSVPRAQREREPNTLEVSNIDSLEAAFKAILNSMGDKNE